MSPEASPTRVAPARAPDGWWMGHPRYRSYVLFAGTGLVLWIVALVLLGGVSALGQGAEAWESYQGLLGSIPGLLLCVLLLLGTLFFSLRWLRVGVKIPQVRLGPLPAPPEPVLWVAHFAGLAAITALVVLLLSGAIV